jgi:toxin ParE1/3/4
MMSNSYKIKTLYSAVMDLKDAKKWYKLQSPVAFKNFINAYEKASNSLKTQPFRTPERNKYNVLLIPKFPYVIFYTVEEASKTIIITAVFNTNQDTIKYPA